MGATLLFVTASAAQPVPEPNLEDECQLHAPGGDLENDSRGGGKSLADQSLTEALGACDGVLEPPPVGDQELTIPPPATGETPVIPPHLLPEQPPQGD